MKIRYAISVIIAIALTLLFMLTTFRHWNLLALINATSLAALLLVMAGFSLLVVGGGFFSGIGYSFRRFFKKTAKSWKALDEIEEDEPFRPSSHSFSMMSPFLVVGIGLFILTFAASLLFF